MSLKDDIPSKKQYAIVLITPDSIRDGLEGKIVEDLIAAVPIEVLWKKYWQIDRTEVVLSIYPTLLEKSAYPSLIRTMTLGECIVILVRGPEDVYDRLRSIKGSFRYDGKSVVVTGLRQKYKTWSEAEIEYLGIKSTAALDKIFEHRLHTTDNLEETISLSSLCMNPAEIESLRIIAPELHHAVVSK